MITAGLNWRSWKLGVYLNTEPLTIYVDAGPFWIEAVRDEPNGRGLSCNWTVVRITVERLKLELRLELDLNFWALGYAAADARDHGVYIGPFNVQIEIDKFYQEQDLVDAWVELHA
ncbi:hypothetical protein [Microvirga yunnanensis]|uniref:hypothetical protein n=1 Tax=Microvirga yunnanensis TaxID=2953740 RepID=UPI0021C5F4C1|nr:hypothetical protein [Microvirga sp. HBU65207]